MNEGGREEGRGGGRRLLPEPGFELGAYNSLVPCPVL